MNFHTYVAAGISININNTTKTEIFDKLYRIVEKTRFNSTHRSREPSEDD